MITYADFGGRSIKTGIRGVYHQVSQKMLQSYLDEYSFRYNHRHDTEPMFLTFLRQIAKADMVIRPEHQS
jgi:hypothetical protein